MVSILTIVLALLFGVTTVLLAIARRRCRSLKTERASLASYIAELEQRAARAQTGDGDADEQRDAASGSNEAAGDGCAEEQETFVETYSMLFDVKNSIPPIVSVLEQSSQRLERDTVTAVKNINDLLVSSTRSMEEVIASVYDKLLTHQLTGEAATERRLEHIQDKYQELIHEITRELQLIVARKEQDLQKMDQIKENVRRIDPFSSSIVEIAEKTQVLSINAKIEAARVHENGRGFRVVAGEVSNLAAESMEIAGKIQSEIDVISNYLNESIATIKETITVETQFLDTTISLLENTFLSVIDNIVSLSSQVERRLGKSGEFHRKMSDLIYNLQFTDINHQAIEYTKRMLSYIESNMKTITVPEETVREIASKGSKIEAVLGGLPIDINVQEREENEEDVTFF